eukprot:SAG22_NODE_11555_length_479_cov_1.073684_1_plen_59_part_10
MVPDPIPTALDAKQDVIRVKSARSSAAGVRPAVGQAALQKQARQPASLATLADSLETAG